MPAGDRSDEGPGGSPTRPRPSVARQVGEPRPAAATNRAAGGAGASGSSGSSGSSSAGAGSRGRARPPRPARATTARPRPAEADFDLEPVDEAGLPVWLSQALATPFDAPAKAPDAAPDDRSGRSAPARERTATQPSDGAVAGPLAGAIDVTETVVAPVARVTGRRDDLDRVLAPTTAVAVVGVPSVLDDLMLTAAMPGLVTAAVPAVDASVPAAAPVTRTTIATRSRRPRVRKVRRVVRSVDAWSVFKVSLVFYALVYVVVLVAGVLLWNLAISTGTVANIEGLVKELFGLDKFTIDGAQLYRASWALGAFLAIGGTGLNVVAAVLFNLITDLVGGVRLTVLEEEVRADLPRRRRFRKAPPADSVDGAAPGSGIVSPP